ncbi:MAG TPA: hypothetical protein EYQ81_02410, partial [Sneathiellales bacterium]|nr:hypothetical protein [Sneathiellales bacterium]
MLRSKDQGTTWEVLRKGDSEAVIAAEDADDINAIGVESLFSVTFINNKQGWVVGQGGLILHTTDSGDTWAKMKTPNETLLMDIWMSPEGEGAAIGMRSLMRTKDFGKNWYALEGAPVTGWWYQAMAKGESVIHMEGATDES